MSSRSSGSKRGSIDWQAVGKRIRQLRGFDVTQEDFSKRINVSQSFLSAVERGKNEMGAEVLLAIIQEFGKSIEWLLTGQEKKPRDVI